AGERRQVLGIDNEQLVLVKLHFDGFGGGDYGHAGAAVVQEQVFEIAEVALEHQQLNILALQIAVLFPVAVMARLHDHVDRIAERVEPLQKNIEEFFARQGSNQHSHAQVGGR